MDFKKRLAELYKLNVDTVEIIESMLAHASEIEVDQPAQADTVRSQAATLEMLRRDTFGRHIELIEAYVKATEDVTSIEREQAVLRMQAKTRRKYGDESGAKSMEGTANKLVQSRTRAQLKQARTLIAVCEGGVWK